MKRLDPIQRAAAKRAARCPDCNSDVAIDATGVVTVSHDDGCPAYAALQRQGRTSSLALFRGTGQTAREFAADVATVAEAYAAEAGPLVPRPSLYDGLRHP